VSRNKSFAAWIARQDEQYYQQTRVLHYSFSGDFFRPSDHFVYEELPDADFTRGGVYFMGASYVEFGTKLWELPPEQRAFIHNCGIEANCHTGEFLMLRYMIEQCGMLSAGGAKNLVVFGASYHSAGGIGVGAMHETFRHAWDLHGFYRCTRSGGIVPLPVTPVSRILRIERLRMAACLSRIQRLAMHQVIPPKPREHNAAVYAEKRSEFMESDWREKIQDQLEEFGRMLDYLRVRDVPVIVVLLPLGSWDRESPIVSYYNQEMTALCKRKDVQVKDWSILIEDEEFGDSSHLNLSGIRKFQSAFLEIALPFMRSVTKPR
jgi:hypothetical protein